MGTGLGTLSGYPPDTPLDTPLGHPQNRLPDPPPGGGKISGNFPGGRPGARAGARRPGRAGAREPSPGPPKMAIFGVILGFICIIEPIFGVSGIPPGLGTPPGPPGRAKSAHFFGYLITLPVGTKMGPLFFRVFSGSPVFQPRIPPLGRLSGTMLGVNADAFHSTMGHMVGYLHRVSAYMTPCVACYDWAGVSGRHPSDGTHWAFLMPNGWYVGVGRPPSGLTQRTEVLRRGQQVREDVSRLR